MLYEKAAETGHWKALINLSNIYSDPDSGEKNRRRALKMIERAMALNVPAAYYNMGVFLQNGEVVKQDRQASRTYMRKAADLGSPVAQYAVAEELLNAFGHERAPHMAESDRERGREIA